MKVHQNQLVVKGILWKLLKVQIIIILWSNVFEVWRKSEPQLRIFPLVPREVQALRTWHLRQHRMKLQRRIQAITSKSPGTSADHLGLKYIKERKMSFSIWIQKILEHPFFKKAWTLTFQKWVLHNLTESYLVGISWEARLGSSQEMLLMCQNNMSRFEPNVVMVPMKLLRKTF